MNILVDYDNILDQHRRHGLVDLVSRIFSALGADRLRSEASAQIRLYGGWYENNVPSRTAQRLIPEIQSNFPTEFYLPDQSSSLRIKTQVELAYSLIIDPSKHLLHTVRKRSGYPHGFRCDSPSAHGCADTSCPLIATHSFLRTGNCPSPSCAITSRQLLHKLEQKLVDTMLTSDIIHIAQQGSSPIALVSSDDDFWPGIRTAELLGTEIFHIHTRKHRTPLTYLGSTQPSAKYHQLQLPI